MSIYVACNGNTKPYRAIDWLHTSVPRFPQVVEQVHNTVAFPVLPHPRMSEFPGAFPSGISDLSDDDADSVYYPSEEPHPIAASTGAIVERVKDELRSLDTAFDQLGEQTAHAALLGRGIDKESAMQLRILREEMRSQEQKQEDGMREVQHILHDVVNKQVVEALHSQIEQDLAKEIDAEVEHQVVQLLEIHMPLVLQDELSTLRRELEDARRALHNSESRRSNAKLVVDEGDQTLRTILMANGRVSSYFPKTLEECFDLEDEKARWLLEDYFIGSSSGVRERDVNQFMQYCGIAYQLREGV